MNGRRRHTDGDLRSVVCVADSGIHGRGLFAVRHIDAGEYIGTFHGPRARRDGAYVLWVYPIGGGGEPVGRSGRNLLRYLNHAAPGNAEFDGFDLYARCPIASGEEITIDYGGGSTSQEDGSA